MWGRGPGIHCGAYAPPPRRSVGRSAIASAEEVLGLVNLVNAEKERTVALTNERSMLEEKLELNGVNVVLLRDKIKDLEAKLAEKERAIHEYDKCAILRDHELQKRTGQVRRQREEMRLLVEREAQLRGEVDAVKKKLDAALQEQQALQQSAAAQQAAHQQRLLEQQTVVQKQLEEQLRQALHQQLTPNQGLVDLQAHLQAAQVEKAIMSAEVEKMRGLLELKESTLAEKSKEFKEDWARLTAELRETRERLHTAETGLMQARSAATEKDLHLQVETKVKAEELRRLKDEVVELRDVIKEERLRYETLLEEKRELEGAERAGSERVRVLSAELDRVKAELAVREERVGQKLEREYSARLQNAEGMVRDARDALSARNQQVEQLQAQLAAQAQDAALQKAAREEVERRLQYTLSETAGREEALARERERAQALEAAVRREAEGRGEGALELERLASQNRTLQDDLAKAREKLALESAQKKQLESQAATIEGEIANLRKKAGALAVNVENEASNRQSLQDQLSSLTQQYEELRNRFKAQGKTLQDEEKRRREAEERRASLENEAGELRREVARLRRLQQEQENKLISLGEQVRSARLQAQNTSIGMIGRAIASPIPQPTIIAPSLPASPGPVNTSRYAMSPAPVSRLLAAEFGGRDVGSSRLDSRLMELEQTLNAALMR